MDKKVFLRRIIVLASVLGCVALVFVFKLLEYQVVRGSEFLEQASNTTIIKVPITAARGELVDRYGRKIATNRIGYNIDLNKLYLPDENLNQTITDLLVILAENGETHIDNTPLSQRAPYTFVSENERDIEKIKNNFGLAQYATAENVWDKMYEKYKLDAILPEYRRMVAGIRYEMDMREYSNVTPYVFATDISMKTVNTIKERSLKMPGVDILEEAIRHYPDGTLMPHIIGGVGPIYADEWQSLKEKGYSMNDIVGKSGLEKAFENELRGTDGVMEVERAVDGSILSTRITKEPVPGKTIVLTIDKNLQLAAQKALADQVLYLQTLDKEGSKGASIVVLDTKDNGVLACATYPSYDLNLRSTNNEEYLNAENTPLFNRALNGLYRPGSAFKTVVGLTGLLEGEIQSDSLISCTGTYQYYASTGFAPPCLMHNHSGPIDVGRALQDSCNIFFYDLGRRIGYDAFNDVAEQLGLGVDTGIEIFEEIGNLSNPEVRREIIEKQLANGIPPAQTSEEWQAGNVVQAAIGQMDTNITTIQLATFASALANSGTRYHTHFLKSISSYDYQENIETKPDIVGQVENKNNAFDIVEQGMIRASFYGTLRDSLKDYPYTIATKTGTPQVTIDTYNATMVAYGPAEQPEIAIGVIVEDCSNSYRLANAVKSIFDAYYFNKSETMSPAQYNTLLP